MTTSGGLRAWLIVTAVLIPWLIVWPSPSALFDDVPGLDVPIDASLRVPFGAAFLRIANPAFEPHDRILDLTFDSEEQLVPPRNRNELRRALERQPESSVSVRLIRGREPLTVHVDRAGGPGWQTLANNWPTIFLGAAFLLFGLTVGLGSRHPVASPLFAVAWCVGVSLLTQVDLLLPEDPGLHGMPTLRSRLGLVSLTLLPASVIHLAMRFPVVSPRFRSSTVAALPYAFWLFPAGFAQIHLQDAAFLNALERIAVGATFLASGVLVLASLTSAGAMTPIERARTRALLLGLGVGGAVPFVHFVWGGRPPAELRTPLILSLLAFPAAISWAIVRYRLLDPPMWVRRTFLSGLTAMAALLLATAGVSFAFSHFGEPVALASAEVIPVALTTIVLYQLLHFGLRRGAVGRVLQEGTFERFLEQASKELATARHPRGVLQRVQSLIQNHLGASEVKCMFESDAARCTQPLVRRGLELWHRERSAHHPIVWTRARDDDPGREVPEIVLSLFPHNAPNALVVVGSRADGLPYGDEQLRMLASLRHVATMALEAAATTADLEAKVADKTRSLERALSDRQAVLHAARAICEAEHRDEVLATLRGFAAAHQVSVHWEAADANAPDGLELSISAEASRLLRLDGIAPGRADERSPQLETLSAFAGLAIGRLGLLAELKREVEHQAQEIAEITSRRLHAEFVRGVAHELRKPTEEVRHRVEELGLSLAPELSGTLSRIRAASREMSRRLDLLLFHSGLRLDLQRIDLVRVVDDAVETIRVGCPDRDYQVEHQLARIPMLGDPSRLLSVLENLLDNSVKATRPGQMIRVRTLLQLDGEQRAGRVRLEVLDEGHGIPADRLHEIFEPGVGLAPSGFGLGLSLCREVVRMHGGSIDVTSKPGATTFCIQLPQFRSGEGDDSHSVHSAS